jgi:hypothetical protein
MSEPFRAALDYAGRGWRVLPLDTVAGGVCSCWRGAACRSAGKHPAEWLGPTGDDHALGTTDPAQIAEWWTAHPTANVGIVCGAASGLVVLDVDPAKGGYESGNQMFPRASALTPTVRTGGGGLHLYFAHPGSKVENRVGFRPGLDLRADGGLVVAPPSLHRAGRRYEYIRAMTVPLAAMPAALLSALARVKPTVPRPPGRVRVFRGTLTPYAEAALEAECAELAGWPRGSEGGRYRRIFKVAAQLGELVAGGALPAALVRSRALDAAAACGAVADYGEATVLKQIEEGLRAGESKPRSGERLEWEPRPPVTEWEGRPEVSAWKR